MKGNSVLFGLAFLLAALSVGITLLSYRWVQLTRSLNQAQSTIALVESRQARLRLLVNEASEFAQQNSAIHPILQGAGLRATPAAAVPEPRLAQPR